jgi:hypothetical protein
MEIFLRELVSTRFKPQNHQAVNNFAWHDLGDNAQVIFHISCQS